jgi:hypothetical protein
MAVEPSVTPATNTPNNTSNAPQISWQDWEAGLAIYIILFLAAETDAAPVAEVIAWGIATSYIIWAVAQSNGLNWRGITNTINTGKSQ